MSTHTPQMGGVITRKCINTYYCIILFQVEVNIVNRPGQSAWVTLTNQQA